MSSKYPMLYVQQPTPTGGLHLNAYDITKRPIFIGQEKLTDLLDELYKLREDMHERETSKEVTKVGTELRAHSDEEISRGGDGYI